MNYGGVIKNLRIAKGYSLRGFAKECEISANTLCAIENNKYEPSKDTIQKIANVIGIHPTLIILSAITENDIPDDKIKAFKELEGPLKAFINS